MTSRPTQKQVAQHAGVSQTVVSQVLNGNAQEARIPPETRRRVLDAIRELGYVPNAAARRLVGGRSSLLGVFTYEAVFPSSTRDFYAPFLEGIEEEAAQSGHDLLLHTSGTGGRRSLSPGSQTRLSLTDGTLLLGDPDDQDRLDLASQLQTGHPMVFIGRRELPGAEILCVRADYTQATAELTRRFQALGHRGLMYVGRPRLTESAFDRELGFRQVAGERSSVLRMDASAFNVAVFQQARAEGVTGFLLENDALMRRFMALAAPTGSAVPGDFSVAVLGDAISGTPSDPTWTGFHVPRREMGRGAVRLLLASLKGEAGKETTFRCVLRPGQTLGDAP